MTAATLQDAVAALTRMGCKPTQSGDQFIAFCPIHEADGQGHNPSLTLKAGDKQPVIVKCHAGCDGKEILKALGLNGTTHPAASIVAVYRYTDETGALVSEKIRHEPKRFSQRYPDGNGGFVYQRPKQSPRVLYRLGEVRAAIADGRTLFVCEGEKDVDRLVKLGLVATTNGEGAAQPDQAAKWRTEYTAQLSGAARVILLPDNDPPGRAHMAHVAMQLRDKVTDLRVLELPGLPAKGDVSDWLNAGHTVDELKALVGKAGPPPGQEPGCDDERGEATNMRLLVPVSQFIGTPRPLSWRIRGLLPGSSIIQLFGDPSAGKSFLTVDWACCIATGRTWIGRATKQTVVLYLAGEGLDGLKRRFAAWQHYREPISDKFLFVACRPVRLDAEGARIVLDEVAAMTAKPQFVVVDTLATVADGDENNTQDMNRFLDIMKTFVTESQATVVYNHHPGHNNKIRERGSSSLRGGVDCSFRMEISSFPYGVLTTTKPPKDGKEIAPIPYQLTEYELPVAWRDPEYPDEPVTTCLFSPSAMPIDPEPRERLPAAQRIALDALRTALVEHGIEEKGVVSVAEDQWRDAAYKAGISTSDKPQAIRRAFQRARDELIADKRVSTQNGRYWIPSPSGTKRYKAVHCTDVYPGISEGGTVQNGTSSFKDVPRVPPTDAPNPEPNGNDQNSAASPPVDTPTADRHCATCRNLDGHHCNLRGEAIERPDAGSCLKWEAAP